MRTTNGWMVVGVVCAAVLAGGCTPAGTTATSAASAAPSTTSTGRAMTNEKSIGQATMTDDGTIVLDLRATGPGMIGDARLTYPKTHPQYQEVLNHLGGLKPGEHKPVPPWDD